MFTYRFNRMQAIDVTDAANKMEYLMAFDSAVVLFRALFLENLHKNYTVQNYFRKTGREATAQLIDDFLDQPFCGWADISRRKALKFIADKFVCHLDNVTNEDLGLCNALMSHLNNPYYDNNFKYIVSELDRIIRSAPDMHLE